MRTVLFTGAGASKALGYPLTSELLVQVREDLRSAELFERNMKQRAAAHRKELGAYLDALLPGFARADDKDLPLITDLFSLVEYSIVNGEALAIGGDAALRHCRNLLKLAITDILIRLFYRPYDLSDQEEKAQKQLLDSLIGWIRKRKNGFALVSTNYDISVEYALWDEIQFDADTMDLGFDWRDPGDDGEIFTRPRNPSHGFYKLHGSFNQLRCSTCGYVYLNSDGSIAHQAFREKLDANNTCHCRQDEKLELNIVSPSLVRDVRDANLLSVWRSALECMRNASHWIIAGYSLPSEDFAIRSLLLRAYTARAEKPQITVVQHGDGARARYRMLFPDCEYRNDGLEGFLAAS